MPGRSVLASAAMLAATGIALGAYAAHGLADRIEALGYAAELAQRVEWFETAIRYHLYHALGLMVVTLLAEKRLSPASYSLASKAFLLGILLFCGSLYVMTFAPADWKKLGAVVPLGGISFIAGWGAVAYGVWRGQNVLATQE